MHKYYIVRDGQKEGPHDIHTLNSLKINEKTLVWRKGMKEWEKANNIPELSEALSVNYESADVERHSSLFNWRVILVLLIVTSVTLAFAWRNGKIGLSQANSRVITDKDLAGKVFKVEDTSDSSNYYTVFYMFAPLPDRTVYSSMDEGELQKDLENLRWLSRPDSSKGDYLDHYVGREYLHYEIENDSIFLSQNGTAHGVEEYRLSRRNNNIILSSGDWSRKELTFLQPFPQTK